MSQPSPASPGISIIIPVLGDEEALARLLPTLRGWGHPGVEIIVADGAGSPSCRALAERYAAVHLATRPGRGHQLHAGATAAAGGILWFLHADATPAPDSLPLIQAHIRRGAWGGHFRFRFDGPATPLKPLLAALINLRVRFGIPYGDQGLFATRDAYLATGGFPDWPLFEEVPVVRALRARGGFAALDGTIGVSPRRWERDGWLRRSLWNRLLAAGFSLGIPPDRLARRYRRLDHQDHQDHRNHREAPPC